MFEVTKIAIDLLTLKELHRAREALETLSELNIDVDRFQTLQYIRLRIAYKEEREEAHPH
jgi:hypothetical protein